MKLTADEQKALAFIAALLLLSAAVRLAALPEPVGLPDPGLDLDAHIEATERAVSEEERRSRPLAEGERLDPNTAPAEELDRLPGVGPALAARIVEARSESRFRSVSDLTRVPGIGERTAARLAGHLAVPASNSEPGAAGAGRSAGSLAAARDVGDVGDLGDVGELIDLNSAGVEELTRLSGIGGVLAARIVAYRDSAGAFVAVDSVVAVPGIGPATLARIRSRLRVGSGRKP